MKSPRYAAALAAAAILSLAACAGGALQQQVGDTVIAKGHFVGKGLIQGASGIGRDAQGRQVKILLGGGGRTFHTSSGQHEERAGTVVWGTAKLDGRMTYRTIRSRRGQMKAELGPDGSTVCVLSYHWSTNTGGTWEATCPASILNQGDRQ